MNVRSLSPQGEGKLLPFRGAPDDPAETARTGAVAVDPADTETGPDHRADLKAPSPRVVDLSGRRHANPEVGSTERRPWVRRAVVASCVVAVVGGATAAALTGALPLSSEKPLHRTAVSAPPTTAGADGNVPAAYGLCTAFDRAAERGDDAATAAAFRNLARAAGGATRVSTYCAPFDDLSRGRAR